MTAAWNILAVGATEAAEFCEAMTVLAAVGHVTTAADVLSALECMSSGEPPDWLVLMLARPGQVHASGLAPLVERAPLARVWAVLGSWCAGEARGHEALAGVVRVSAAEFPARVASEVQRGWPSWSMPATANEEERLLARLPASDERREGTIVVCSRQRELATALADACRQRGYSVVQWLDTELTPAAGALAVLWDTEPEEACDERQVARLSHAARGAAVIALVGFAHKGDIERAQRAGVVAVIGKPFELGELYWRLDATEMQNGGARR